MNQAYWPVIDSAEIKTSELIKICRNFFNVYFYNEETADNDFPAPAKTTLRYFKANIEADEDLKNKSANQLKKEKIDCITLRERLWLEIQYFCQTGNHLDIDSLTLCSGSRYSDGSVPGVFWRSDLDGLRVGWYDSGYAVGSLRGRVVIKTLSSNLDPLREEWEKQGYGKGWIKEGKIICQKK